MGTDIHFYVERRVNGQWESCDKWEPDKYEENEPKPLTVPYEASWYTERNYDLFAMLADVRNGHGFAGCDTGDGFIPIVAPRGLPGDLSPQMKIEAERCLDHTPSWLTVAELMAYDWTQTTTLRGWVSGPQFLEWTGHRKDRGFGPEAYCGGISGGNVNHVTEQEMFRRVKEIVQQVGGNWWDARDEVKRRLKDYYCPVSWQTPYYRSASHFLSEVLPRLWRLGKPEDVRIVFWFDS